MDVRRLSSEVQNFKATVTPSTVNVDNPNLAVTMFGGYSNMDARNTVVTNKALTGTELPNAPRQSASLFVKYRIQSGPLMKLGLGVGARWVGVTHGPSNTNLEAPPYNVFTAQVDYTWRNYTFNVVVNNVFDEQYNGSTKLGDGQPAREHYAAWVAYWKEYTRQRAREGLFSEAAQPGSYGRATIGAYLDLFDLADDAELRRLGEAMLNLHFAQLASEFEPRTGTRGTIAITRANSGSTGTQRVFP